MKKILYIPVIIVLLISCEKSPENKAKALIKENLRTTLHDFSSYEPVTFGSLDSTFTNCLGSPEYVSVLKELDPAMEKSAELRKDIETGKKIMDSFVESGLHLSSPDSYKEIKRIYDESVNEGKEVYAELEAFQNKLESIKNTFTPEFNGWSMVHSFRSKTLGGNYKLAGMIFYFDPGLTMVLKTEDPSGEDE